jgi:putative membrane protein
MRTNGPERKLPLSGATECIYLRYLVASWALNVVVLGIVTVAFDHVTSKNFGDLLVAAIVFGVLNTILKPILRLVTLPFAVLTLGLIWFGVSMLMLWLTSVLVSGFAVHGFWTFVGATVTIWAANAALEFVDYFWRRGRRRAVAAAA